MKRHFFKYVDEGGYAWVHEGINLDDLVSTAKYHGRAGPTQGISVKS